MFKDNLLQLRKLKNMTQEDIADKVGVSRQAVAKWGTASAYPDIDNLIQLSNLFHVTVDYLIKEQECSLDANQGKPSDMEELIAFRLKAPAIPTQCR